MQNNTRLDFELPKTTKKAKNRQGRPLLVLSIIVIFAGVVSWFWLARSPEARDAVSGKMEELRATAPILDTVVSKVEQTLFEKAPESALENAPSVSPEETARPSTSSSEQGVTGASDMVNAPAMNHGAEQSQNGEVTNATDAPQGAQTSDALSMDPADRTLEGGASARGTVVPVGAAPPQDVGKSEDVVVRSDFITDLAKWLVNGYQPANQGRGTLNVSLQAANLRYGVGMKGLRWVGDDLPTGRSEALQYVFTPAMLEALYNMYVNTFMADVADALETRTTPRGRALSAEQKADMYQLYARRLHGVSGALQAAAGMPDLSAKLDALRSGAQAVVAINAQYAELVFAQDQAREAGNTGKVESLGKVMQAVGTAYQQAVATRERDREVFAREMRRNANARILDDETLIYIAQWVDRRVRDTPEKNKAALSGANLFNDLALRFERAATGAQE